jgi:menaquinone reductase, iron-sulfur cluster-binding subunit
MSQNGNSKEGARYGMVIDLDRCSGCGACMVACAVENNVAPPLATATPRTGMNWIRVFRVEVEGKSRFVPVLCMQCENEAPCVSVCPQNATEFDPATGVVGQIPERCLGCRYCMAACPYQARVFNWADPTWPAMLEQTLNPNVSVRQRGTVEKCTFCHGRWHAAREKAAAQGGHKGAPVDYVPACVEACPTQAIQFGNLRHSGSPGDTVRRNESFVLLAELDTQPKVSYKTAQPALAQALKERKAVTGHV